MKHLFIDSTRQVINKFAQCTVHYADKTLHDRHTSLSEISTLILSQNTLIFVLSVCQKSRGLVRLVIPVSWSRCRGILPASVPEVRIQPATASSVSCGRGSSITVAGRSRITGYRPVFLVSWDLTETRVVIWRRCPVGAIGRA